MDEAVTEAFRAIREDVSGMRADLKAHVLQDAQDIGEVRSQVTEWMGQLKIIKWLSGAILTAMIAYGAKHW